MNENKLDAEIQDLHHLVRVVGERSASSEAQAVRPGGTGGSENAGMSSESPMKIRTAEYPRFPTQRSSSWGKSGPNMRPAQLA